MDDTSKSMGMNDHQEHGVRKSIFKQHIYTASFTTLMEAMVTVDQLSLYYTSSQYST